MSADTENAALVHRAVGPGGLKRVAQAVQRIKDRCDDRAGHLWILDECDRALGILTDLDAAPDVAGQTGAVAGALLFDRLHIEPLVREWCAGTGKQPHMHPQLVSGLLDVLRLRLNREDARRTVVPRTAYTAALDLVRAVERALECDLKAEVRERLALEAAGRNPHAWIHDATLADPGASRVAGVSSQGRQSVGTGADRGEGAALPGAEEIAEALFATDPRSIGKRLTWAEAIEFERVGGWIAPTPLAPYRDRAAAIRARLAARATAPDGSAVTVSAAGAPPVSVSAAASSELSGAVGQAGGDAPTFSPALEAAIVTASNAHHLCGEHRPDDDEPYDVVDARAVSANAKLRRTIRAEIDAASQAAPAAGVGVRDKVTDDLADLPEAVRNVAEWMDEAAADAWHTPTREHILLTRAGLLKAFRALASAAGGGGVARTDHLNP